METKTMSALDLLDKAKECERYTDICDLVREWTKSRKNNDLEPLCKFASLAGILESNISLLLDHIVTLEKRNEELKNK